MIASDPSWLQPKENREKDRERNRKTSNCKRQKRMQETETENREQMHWSVGWGYYANPLRRWASTMSFFMIVTRLAWMAQSRVSSMSLTRKSSATGSKRERD